MNPYQRSRNLFDPNSKTPFKLSRTKIELFIECPKCFYLDRRLGIGRPPGFPFNLNIAVDNLLKKEFDILRAKEKAHPLMKHYGIKAVPFKHENMSIWRENFVGVQVLHEPTNLIIFGAVDDIWQAEDGSLHVVDYKATSTNKPISLEEPYRIVFKRQMEMYQWLLRNIGHKVSDLGYFVYCNGLTDREAFDSKLEFDIEIIPYKGDDSWVEDMIIKADKCLKSNKIPKATKECEYCRYREAVREVEG